MPDTSKYVISEDNSRLYQGELLSDVLELGIGLDSLIAAYEQEPGVELELLSHPFAIVLSQDCDLSQDFMPGDEFAGQPSKGSLRNVLLCGAAEISDFKATANLASDRWRMAKTNSNERYHVLEAVPPDCDLCAAGLSAMGMDFKHYFTVPTAALYRSMQIGKLRRRCRLEAQYAEHLSHRFAHFLSRIALPEDHTVELPPEPSKISAH